MKKTFKFILFFVIVLIKSAFAQGEQLKIGVVGLTHTLVHGILGNENTQDFKIVGIVEPNKMLIENYKKQNW